MSEENNEVLKNTGKPPANDKNEIISPNDDYANDDKLDANGNPIVIKPNESDNSENDDATDDTKIIPNSNDEIVKAAKDVEGMLTEAGLTGADVAKAITENDGMTPEILAALVKKHGEGVAGLIADKLVGLHTANKEAGSKRDQAVYDQVHEAFNDPQGGKETFAELSTWAKDNIPNADRVEINKMLAQGGMAAKLAVAELISKFKGSENFTQAADLEVADNLSNEKGGKPLDKAGYNREMRTLRDKGHIYGQSQEMETLDRRRTAGLKRGI